MRHAARRYRGSILLYAGAFGLLVLSAYFCFEGNTKSSLPMVRLSMGISLAAMLTAIASLFFPRR
jgi:hypothetical protein